eukprot:359170-Chlamydomonas_euryale.AAC.4
MTRPLWTAMRWPLRALGQLLPFCGIWSHSHVDRSSRHSSCGKSGGVCEVDRSNTAGCNVAGAPGTPMPRSLPATGWRRCCVPVSAFDAPRSAPLEAATTEQRCHSALIPKPMR